MKLTIIGSITGQQLKNAKCRDWFSWGSCLLPVGAGVATAGEGTRPVRPSQYFGSLTFNLFS